MQKFYRKAIAGDKFCDSAWTVEMDGRKDLGNVRHIIHWGWPGEDVKSDFCCSFSSSVTNTWDKQFQQRKNLLWLMVLQVLVHDARKRWIECLLTASKRRANLPSPFSSLTPPRLPSCSCTTHIQSWSFLFDSSVGTSSQAQMKMCRPLSPKCL